MYDALHDQMHIFVSRSLQLLWFFAWLIPSSKMPYGEKITMKYATSGVFAAINLA